MDASTKFEDLCKTLKRKQAVDSSRFRLLTEATLHQHQHVYQPYHQQPQKMDATAYIRMQPPMQVTPPQAEASPANPHSVRMVSDYQAEDMSAIRKQLEQLSETVSMISSTQQHQQQQQQQASHGPIRPARGRGGFGCGGVRGNPREVHQIHGGRGGHHAKLDVQCYNCGKRGHFQRDCWAPRKQQNRKESHNERPQETRRRESNESTQAENRKNQVNSVKGEELA